MCTEDLTGQRFGRLLVIGRGDDYICPDGRRRDRWICKCDCGNIKSIRRTCLKSGDTQSCGCLCKEKLSNVATKHGGYGTSLNNIWNGMRQRCNNPKNNHYDNYGARGIRICEEWDDFSVFRDWAYDNGYDPTLGREKCSLDRIDVNGDYTPDNCRWVSMKEQGRNKRNTIYLTYNDETHALAEWAEIVGQKYSILHSRYSRGLNAEEILKGFI